MASWLLHCTALPDGTDWPIRQHWKHVRAGDDVAVWRSGPDGGVVALGRVTGVPRRTDGGRTWVVPVEYTAEFTAEPVSRDTLAADPRFANALILRMSGGRNPIALTAEEWAAVIDHAPPAGSQLVATAVKGAAVVVAVGATAVREALKSAVSR